MTKEWHPRITGKRMGSTTQAAAGIILVPHPRAEREFVMPDPAPLVLVMGVSGSGKSTVDAALARGLGVPYADADADADSFQPPANLDKMASGQALEDHDRHRGPRRSGSGWRPRGDRGGAELIGARAQLP